MAPPCSRITVLDVPGRTIRGNHHGDVALDTGQVLECPDAEAFGNEALDGGQQDRGEDDVFTAHLVGLEQFRVKLADASDDGASPAAVTAIDGRRATGMLYAFAG